MLPARSFLAQCQASLCTFHLAWRLNGCCSVRYEDSAQLLTSETDEPVRNGPPNFWKAFSTLCSSFSNALRCALVCSCPMLHELHMQGNIGLFANTADAFANLKLKFCSAGAELAAVPKTTTHTCSYSCTCHYQHGTTGSHHDGMWHCSSKCLC